MADIVVTTPKRLLKASAEEAEHSRRLFWETGEVTRYFRNFPARSVAPPLETGDRLYYVEDGFVRGYLVVSDTEEREEGLTCATHGIEWPAGFYAYALADSWRWIFPIPMLGFQGWRYAERCGLDRASVTVVGGWLDDMPEVAG